MSRIRGGRRRWLVAAGGVVLAAAAGCQSSPDPGQASPATGPAVVQTTPPDAGVQGAPAGRTSPAPDPTTPAPTTPRCHTADLALEVGQADSAMGRTGLDLALVNTSKHRCRIYGYGGVQLLDAAGAALPTHQARGGRAPELLTLRPGQRAFSLITWIHRSDMPPCSTPAFLQVIPPDETKPIRAPFAYPVCGNGVLGQGAYHGTPV